MRRNVVALARRAVALGLVMAAVAAGSVGAQANLTVYGSAGLDGEGTNIQLIGGTARFGDQGWAPEVGLQVYHLGYDQGDDDNASVFAVMPSVGASYRLPVGQVGARVGYSFQSDDDGGVPIIDGEGGGSGVVTAAQGNYWGPGPELQGIASYNWGSEYLWTNAQALVPIARVGPGTLRAGVDAVWQGHTDGGSNAIQLGPIVKLSTGNNFSINVSGGWKHFGGDGDDRDDTWYARIGAVRYGIDLF
ncbi:MAG TPA: hypothetical protein VFS20_01925 [Longimicrobium sp.]|nr:hypothetical protein [Longimicrobium sp.]